MQCKQQLMLLCLKSMFFGCHFAEVKKLSDLSSKLGQIPIFVY